MASNPPASNDAPSTKEYCDELDDDNNSNLSNPENNHSTTSHTTTSRTTSTRRAAWILNKLHRTVDFLTPHRRKSTAYTKVGGDEGDNDDDDTSIQMTGVVLEDIDLEESEAFGRAGLPSTFTEERTTGLSAALDLPAPWELNSPTRLSHSTQKVSSTAATATTATTTTHTPFPSSPSSPSAASSSAMVPFGCSDGLQIIPTLLLASAALAATGSVLDQAQHWVVFETRTAYFVAMPMLFGIKGNLDMTLASRLTSALHSGELTGGTSSSSQRRVQIYQSSLALLQVQAIVCGGIAGMLTMLLTDCQQCNPDHYFEDVITVVASIVVTAMIAAFVFGLLTFGLVLGGDRAGCNPDNIATPLVSSLGDLASLVLLAAVATLMDWFSKWGGLSYAAPLVLLVCTLIVLPCLWWVAAKDKACAQALKTGWIPILVALGISQFAGMALETSIVSYQGVGIFVSTTTVVG